MRAINKVIRPYKGLELHPNVTRVLSLAHTTQGLTLITGITGSGKSTTLDSIIDANNHTVDGHVVIIASPGGVRPHARPVHHPAPRGGAGRAVVQGRRDSGPASGSRTSS